MLDKRRILKGCVINDKMQKSIVVTVDKLIEHKIYKKIIKRTTKFHVHDINNTAKIGDLVTIQECSPISKTKSWQLISIIKKN